MFKFCKTQLWECSRTLSDVAMGRKPAETVIRNARLVNVCTHEILDNTDVAISCGRIALVGDAAHCIGESTKVIDAEGQLIAPGFLDGHIHIESSMMTPIEYAKAVIPHGTVGIYYDPHEVCNVLGLKGVDLMAEEAEKTPLKAMLTTPSCVPAVPGFEDSGAEITAADIASEMKHDYTVGLGEMMNFPGITASAEPTHNITGETLKAGKIITGHYSIPETGRGLNAYIASGVRCCHESTRAEDALAKMRLGMYAMLREGSAWHDLQEVSKAITEHKVDSRFATMISDDTRIRWLQTVISITSCVVPSPSVSILSPLSRWSRSTAHNASRWITSSAPSPRASARTSYLLITKKTSVSPACSSTATSSPRTTRARSISRPSPTRPG